MSLEVERGTGQGHSDEGDSCWETGQSLAVTQAYRPLGKRSTDELFQENSREMKKGPSRTLHQR